MPQREEQTGGALWRHSKLAHSRPLTASIFREPETHTLTALHSSLIYMNCNKATNCNSVLPAAGNVLPQNCPCCQLCMRAAVNIRNSFICALIFVQLVAGHHQYDCAFDWAVHNQVYWCKNTSHEINSDLNAAPLPRTSSIRQQSQELWRVGLCTCGGTDWAVIWRVLLAGSAGWHRQWSSW